MAFYRLNANNGVFPIADKTSINDYLLLYLIAIFCLIYVLVSLTLKTNIATYLVVFHKNRKWLLPNIFIIYYSSIALVVLVFFIILILSPDFTMPLLKTRANIPSLGITQSPIFFLISQAW